MVQPTQFKQLEIDSVRLGRSVFLAAAGGDPQAQFQVQGFLRRVGQVQSVLQLSLLKNAIPIAVECLAASDPQLVADVVLKLPFPTSSEGTHHTNRCWYAALRYIKTYESQEVFMEKGVPDYIVSEARVVWLTPGRETSDWTSLTRQILTDIRNGKLIDPRRLRREATYTLLDMKIDADMLIPVLNEFPDAVRLLRGRENLLMPDACDTLHRYLSISLKDANLHTATRLHELLREVRPSIVQEVRAFFEAFPTVEEDSEWGIALWKSCHTRWQTP